MWLGFEKLRPLGGQRGVPIFREINTELMKCGVDTLWRKDASVSMARTLRPFAASRKWAEQGRSPGGSCSMELVMDVVGCSYWSDWRLSGGSCSTFKVCQHPRYPKPLNMWLYDIICIYSIQHTCVKSIHWRRLLWRFSLRPVTWRGQSSEDAEEQRPGCKPILFV